MAARSCIGCRRSLPKGELLRLARAPDGTLRPDPAGRMQGRGAYVCDRSECAERARSAGAYGRSLRAPVTVTNETIEFIGEWQRSASTR